MGLWKVDWILLMAPLLVYGGISVHFKTGGPLYVAPGQTLVLEAVFVKNPEDTIDMVKWECDRGHETVRLTHGDRISLEKNDLRLQITNIKLVEFGTYMVIVTDSNGQQEQASIEVRKIDEPPKASVSHVLKCDVNNATAQWDDPQFSWFVDGDAVTDQMALLADGRSLNISKVKGRNYTCVVNSSLGTSKAHYQTPKESQNCPSQNHSGPVAVAVAVAIILIICVAGGIIIFIIKKRRDSRGVAVPN